MVMVKEMEVINQAKFRFVFPGSEIKEVKACGSFVSQFQKDYHHSRDIGQLRRRRVSLGWVSTGLLERVERNEVYQELKTPGQHDSCETHIVGRALFAVALTLNAPLKEFDGVLNVVYVVSPLLYR